MPAGNTESPAAIGRSVTLDVSVAIPWVVQEQSNAAIDALFQDGYRRATVLLVPALWWWECGNVLNEMVKRKRLTATEAQEGFAVLRYARPEPDWQPTIDVQQRTLLLAQSHRLSFYDAAYLELAQRRNSVLATLDRDLRAAARAAGVLCLDL